MPGMKMGQMADVGDVPFDMGLINGRGRAAGDTRSPLATFRVGEGRRVRFRIINASSTYAFLLQEERRSRMSWLRKQEWTWWQAGLLLGLLNTAAFYTADYYLSVSTTFSRAAGMLAGLLAPAHVAANPYWQMVKPIVDWQFMLVLGIPMGAYLAARTRRGAIHFTAKLPEVWVNRFGTSPGQRWAVGLLGGILVGFGARLADG